MDLKSRKLRIINSICFLIGSYVNDSINIDEFVNRVLLVLKSYYFDFYGISFNEEDK